MTILFLGLVTTMSMVEILYANTIQSSSLIGSLSILLFLWSWTCLALIPWKGQRFVQAPARWFRHHIVAMWLIWLFSPLVIFITAENTRVDGESGWFVILSGFWCLFLVTFVGDQADNWRVVATRLNQSRWTGVLLSLSTFILILVLVEISLRIFVFTNTYAVGPIHRQWMQRYWSPINRIGYRDYDFVPREGTRRHIIVVGDSFTAGLGVEDIDDTFPHILERLLGFGYQVNIVAQPGWHTDAQLAALHGFPFPPDVVILSYFLNDIAYWDLNANNYFNEIYPLPPLVIRPLVDNFHLPSFLYWNVYQQLLRGGEINYAASVQKAFQNPNIWSFHSRDLQAMLEWTQEQNATFIVLIWPFLTDVKASEPMASQVEIFMIDNGVPTVNLAHELRDIPPLQLIANPFDMHPNEATHYLAAEKLYELLTKMETTLVFPTSEADN